MADVTLATLWQRVSEKVGEYISFTTSSAGSTDYKTAVSTELMEYDDGTIKGYLYASTSTGAEERRIENNLSPSGTILVYRPFSAQNSSGISMEVFPYSKINMTRYINDAIRNSYPYLAKEVHDTELIGNNVLVNSSFEKWTATTNPDYWTKSTATVSEETTIKLFGASSMKLGTAAGSCYLSSDDWPVLRQFEDSTVSWYCWVNTAAASNARIGVYYILQDGTTTDTEYSDYHTGGGEFELLSLEDFAIPDELAEIRFICATATTDAAYFDNAHCMGSVVDYLLPDTLDSVIAVYQCNDCDEFVIDDWLRLDWELVDKAGTKYIRIYDASAEKRLELVGYAPYTALSASTSTVDLSPDWQRAIVAGSVASLLKSNASLISSQSIGEVLKLADAYSNEFESLKIINSKNIQPYQLRKWS